MLENATTHASPQDTCTVPPARSTGTGHSPHWLHLEQAHWQRKGSAHPCLNRLPCPHTPTPPTASEPPRPDSHADGLLSFSPRSLLFVFRLTSHEVYGTGRTGQSTTPSLADHRRQEPVRCLTGRLVYPVVPFCRTNAANTSPISLTPVPRSLVDSLHCVALASLLRVVLGLCCCSSNNSDREIEA